MIGIIERFIQKSEDQKLQRKIIWKIILQKNKPLECKTRKSLRLRETWQLQIGSTDEWSENTEDENKNGWKWYQSWKKISSNQSENAKSITNNIRR